MFGELFEFQAKHTNSLGYNPYIAPWVIIMDSPILLWLFSA
jgi:hypothetical protein